MCPVGPARPQCVLPPPVPEYCDTEVLGLVAFNGEPPPSGCTGLEWLVWLRGIGLKPLKGLFGVALREPPRRGGVRAPPPLAGS